jgi:hypothetical protein
LAVYHQIGHDSENLLHAPNLEAYRGAILSPVNYDQARVSAQVERARRQGNFDTIFDPQLYVPTSERGVLREWTYFPTDVDTADLNSEAWWNSLNDRVVAVCRQVDAAAVCSPAVVPNAYTYAYYASSVRVGSHLCHTLNGTGVRPIQTAIVGLSDLATRDRAFSIASIISQTEASEIYLVLVGTTEPRRELAEVEELKGAMRLIAALEDAGLRLIVSFSSTDVILWKAAGATHCASGKFFNLRRFTRTRFEEPRTVGGGQLPYWFEEALMAFLRESDLQRVLPLQLEHLNETPNPFGMEILNQLRAEPGKAWLALAWRQFLFWFADVESRITAGTLDVNLLLRNAEQNWRTMDDRNILMEERRNDGGWIRAWRRALAEYHGS